MGEMVGSNSAQKSLKSLKGDIVVIFCHVYAVKNADFKTKARTLACS